MNGWIIAFIAWQVFALGIYAAKHGEPKTGTYSFWHGLIGFGINFFLLYMGGIFG